MRRLVACLTGAVAILATVPAQATTYQVNVSSNSFDPPGRTVSPGDRLNFAWIDGTHTVTAYAGDTFDSGSRGPGSSFAYIYPGGATVKYRCSLHGTISDTGECTGMCGVIDENPIDLIPPSVVIERPTERAVVTPTPQVDPGEPLAPVIIEGAAGDNVSVYAVSVRIYDTLGRASLYAATCEGCGSRVVRWNHRSLLPPGSYVVEAIAADASGNSRTSSRRSFIVI
jgi:plastocyanin